MRENYAVPLPVEGWWREILNTDAEIYGGTNKGNGGKINCHRKVDGSLTATLTLPPLATIMLEAER